MSLISGRFVLAWVLTAVSTLLLLLSYHGLRDAVSAKLWETSPANAAQPNLAVQSGDDHFGPLDTAQQVEKKDKALPTSPKLESELVTREGNAFLEHQTSAVRKLQAAKVERTLQTVSESSATRGGAKPSGTGGSAWWKYVEQLGGWQNYIDLVVATTPRIHYQGSKPHYPRASTTPSARELESRLALSLTKKGSASGVATPVEDVKFEKGSGEFSWFFWAPKPAAVNYNRIIEDELQEMVNARLHKRGFPHGVNKPSRGVNTPEEHPAAVRERLLQNPASLTADSGPATQGEESGDGEVLVDVGEGLMADVGFHAKNVTLEPGLVGVFMSGCGETCGQHGTCNEEMGRCDCPWDHTGRDCAVLAMPACRIGQNRTIPCNQPAPCACYLQCERFGFGHSHACFDVNPPYISEGAIWSAPQVVIRTDGRGHEEGSVRTSIDESDPNWRKVLPSRFCPLGCSDVGWCERDSELGVDPPSAHCNCPFGFAGAGCEIPEKRRDIRVSCLNDCSGRGVCNRGFCHCKPGAFGIDCSLSPGTPSLVFTQPGTLLATGSEGRDRMQKDEESWIYTYEQSRRPIFMARKRAKAELEQAGFADPLFVPEPSPSATPMKSYGPGGWRKQVPRGIPQGVPGGGADVEYIPFIQPQLIEANPAVLQQAIDSALGGVETGQEATPSTNPALLQQVIDSALGGGEAGQEATPSPQQAAVAAVVLTGQSEEQVTELTGNPAMDVGAAEGEGDKEVLGGVVEQGEEGGAQRREEVETAEEENQGGTRGEGETGVDDSAGPEEKAIEALEEGLPLVEHFEGVAGDGGETGGLVLEEDRTGGGEMGQEILGEEQDTLGGVQDTLGAEGEADGEVKEWVGQEDPGRIGEAVDEPAEETPQLRRSSRFRKVLEWVEFRVGGEEHRGKMRGGGVGNRALLLVQAGVDEVDPNEFTEEKTPDQYRGAEMVSRGAAHGTAVSRGFNRTANRNPFFNPMRTPSPSEMDELYLNQTVQNLIRQEEMRWFALKRAYPNNTFYQKPLSLNITQLRQTAVIQLRNVRLQLEMQQRIREAKLEEERRFVASLAHMRNKTRGRGAAQPLIYVYELPPHLNTWTYVHSGAGADRTAPVIFLERLLHSPHRTTDPKLADFFFVPAWPRWHLNRGPYLESVVQYLRATWPYFDARGGADHIWFTTDDWGPCEETGFRNRVIGAGVLLTFWGYDKNARNGGDEPCFIPGQDIVVPPNLEYDILAKRKEAEERGRLRIGLRNRTNWFYFAGSSGRLAESTGTGRKEYSFGVRQAVFDHFEDDNRFKLEELRFGASDYLAEMANSLFCLAPSGHGWGTRATQAVILGCVPVVIQNDVTQPFEYDLIDWETFGVRIRNEDVPRIPQILGAIHVTEIEKKQRIMGQVWPRFLWQSHSEGPLEVIQAGDYKDSLKEVLQRRDAFSTTMEVLQQRLQMED
ncbi:Exostosin family protein [Klebsormidium nitens]|uniref:Exostosin family protein n=1 Tax=Klebsormidium nitens TaxID=105231 RepID=A0A1Y1IGR4_KLENI|nr:Exostosin family protein [Klebsormidium nitens]|eukprot:GAQ89252.1 Exostosin family protein [Klebsormidium nitens]